MSLVTEQRNPFDSIFWGIGRGVAVDALIYPLDVVKIRYQCSEKSVAVALKSLKVEGVGSFYKGFSPQLAKTVLKQVYRWPAVIEIPPILHSFGLRDLQQQFCTGVVIAAFEAAIVTPLDKAQKQMANGDARFSIGNIYKEGWRGFNTYFAKSSVGWCTFLVAQKYLRDLAREKPEEVLSFSQLTSIGVQSALIVSVFTSPVDNIHTINQIGKFTSSRIFSGNVVRNLYRGWPLYTFYLTIHNVASVIIIDKLEKRS